MKRKNSGKVWIQGENPNRPHNQPDEFHLTKNYARVTVPSNGLKENDPSSRQQITLMQVWKNMESEDEETDEPTQFLTLLQDLQEAIENESLMGVNLDKYFLEVENRILVNNSTNHKY